MVFCSYAPKLVLDLWNSKGYMAVHPPRAAVRHRALNQAASGSLFLFSFLAAVGVEPRRCDVG